MARSQSRNHTLTYVAGAVAVVGVAFGLGYFVIGGNRSQHPAETAVPQTVIPQPAPAPTKPVPTRIAATVRTQNGEYTAPGAPRIQITEDKTPSLIDTSKLQPKSPDAGTKPNDAEASQEAIPTPKTISTGTTTSDNTIPSTDTTAPGADSAVTNPDTNSSPPNTASPTDPDTEQVTGHGDAEANQEAPGGKAQFRVQAGSFVAEENAKALADALKRRGYATSTHAERDGSKTVYKVQVGAYRSRVAADKAAQDLQSSGYPASVSPLSP